MAKTREIKGRIKAVGNIQRITKTMQMIATARFNAAQRRATASKPYSRKIAELVGELAGSVGERLQHPLLRQKGSSGRELLLVLTSNRGLCGGYNANILRMVAQHLRQREGKSVDIEVVGKKGMAFFRFTRRQVQASHTQFGDSPRYEEVEKLANRYMQAFSEGKYDAVHVIYMAFQSLARQRADTLELLPLKPPAVDSAQAGKAKAAVDYDFSPDAGTLLNELLPITVRISLFQCFNEAVVSEQVARMIAMKAATDSAKKMKKNLTLKYNRARQAAITTELTEIIGGTAALEG